MTKGDIVLFKPSKVAQKSNDNLGRLIKQYDSPCVVYQIIKGWIYLYRLMDGGIHVAQSNDSWQCIDIDLGMYEDKLFIIGHLLEVGVG